MAYYTPSGWPASSGKVTITKSGYKAELALIVNGFDNEWDAAVYFFENMYNTKPEDVIVENKQAIEMADIYSGILSGMMDAFASVISNNLNIVMKTLAIITIVMAIPTIIFSAYGMNVNADGMPFAENPLGFTIIVFMGILISIGVALLFRKAKMFK